MSVRIQYAYLKQQTWLYRRNYPRELQSVLGLAMKQSLKTGDARVAKARAAEVNVTYDELVKKARAGVLVQKPEPIRLVPAAFPAMQLQVIGRTKVSELGQVYLNKRSDELRPGGFKSVRFGIGLFVSLYGGRQIGQLTRDDAKVFFRLVAELAPHVGKSERHKGLGLERLVTLSAKVSERISPQTQMRIVSQVGQFLDWAVYEGELVANPFATVRVEQKARVNSYVAPTDAEARRLLAHDDPRISKVLLVCLLSGMRAGEAGPSWLPILVLQAPCQPVENPCSFLCSGKQRREEGVEGR